MNDTVHKGKSISLFLVDGTPQGVLIAEIMNWTGYVVSCSRAKIVDLVKRTELSGTGLYFLTGPDPDVAGKMLVYIGESDDVKRRLVQHNKDESKDFWERACVVTSKDANLTKTHVRYLESRLISIAQDSGQANIVNRTAPYYDSLPESHIADMEFFLSQIQLVLPVLGLEFLRKKPKIKKDQKNEALEKQDRSTSPVFVAQLKKLNIVAEAQEVEGDFVVFEGSEARAEWCDADHSYKALHASLIRDGKLIVSAGSEKAVFKEDTVFKSPSAASAVVLGRAGSRTAWKIKGSNKTYSDWIDEEIEAAERRLQTDPK